jgi:hypothetical protein
MVQCLLEGEVAEVLVFHLEMVEVLGLGNLVMGEMDLEELLELKLVEELKVLEDLVVVLPQEMGEMVVMLPIQHKQVIMEVVLGLMVMLLLFLTMVQELKLLIMDLLLEFMVILYIKRTQHN